MTYQHYLVELLPITSGFATYFSVGSYENMQNLIFSVLTLISFSSCQAATESSTPKSAFERTRESVSTQKLDTATIAGGCFWCIEAAVEQIKGVSEAVSGYAGGTEATADYISVSTGRTDHAEVVQVYYDPTILSYETLLKIFFTAHDPTQVNRQGPDAGRQYRTAIFYHNEAQMNSAIKVITEIKSNYSEPIATEVVPLEVFYLAESYHQDYDKRNPYQPYILRISKPKVEKVKKAFPDRIKED
ncbi:MAG: peptide-methionine (S)-S-oxide reductase [Cyclobacteriaceae bacterium]|jgi:peptide-methionine (S)-S-oxide reductase